MATKIPRVSFSPTPATHALLQRMSAASGRAPSSITREVMDATLPHLAMMADLLERAATITGGVREAADAAAQEAGRAIIPLLEEAERAFSNLERVLEEPGLPLSDLPPASNTGASSGSRDQRRAA